MNAPKIYSKKKNGKKKKKKKRKVTEQRMETFSVTWNSDTRSVMWNGITTFATLYKTIQGSFDNKIPVNYRLTYDQDDVEITLSTDNDVQAARSMNKLQLRLQIVMDDESNMGSIVFIQNPHTHCAYLV